MQTFDKKDSDIVQDYLEGDENSLNIIIDRYLGQIYNFTYYICNNTEEAEDITQEVFVKFWKNIKKYNPQKNFKVWLFSIAKNTTVDWLRKRKNIPFSFFDSNSEENFIENTVKDENPLPLELAISKEETGKISEQISKLSPIYRTILTMKYTEDLSFKEISDILEIPENTIRSQHRRALIELRKNLS